MKYTVKRIAKKTMTEKKRKSACNDIFAFYVGRPISYVFTIPCLYFGIKPNTVSLISIIFPILAYVIVLTMQSYYSYYLGLSCLFIWNIMDGVDGNIARYTEHYSKLGSVWDAASGYFAMVFTYSTLGLIAYCETSMPIYLTLGWFAGLSTVMPRLIMHKKMNELNANDDEFMDKSQFNLLKIVALNLTSPAGMVQIIIFVGITFKIIPTITLCYFIFNTFVMLAAMYKLLHE